MSTAAQTREPGFYWVRHHSRWWTIGQWGAEYEPSWEIVGQSGTFQDEDMSEIDERRIERQP